MFCFQKLLSYLEGDVASWWQQPGFQTTLGTRVTEWTHDSMCLLLICRLSLHQRGCEQTQNLAPLNSSVKKGSNWMVQVHSWRRQSNLSLVCCPIPERWGRCSNVWTQGSFPPSSHLACEAGRLGSWVWGGASGVTMSWDVPWTRPGYWMPWRSGALP